MEGLRDGDPREVGGFRLEGRLGAGGMGEVFLGRSPGGRRVAVKLIRPEHAGDRQFRARFAREVEAARRVGGFHTAQLVAADPEANPPWLVTAYVEGPSLRDLVLDRGPLDPAAVRRLAAELAEGLAAIHASGLVHRDLKPGNIIMAADGARIIDFGIVRDVESTALTSSGVVLGTYSFMSPEQVRADRAGPASDVFALGSVLAFAATGHGPFDDTTIPSIVRRIVYEPPRLDGVPAGLRDVLQHCLAKDPARRPTLPDLIATLTTDQRYPTVVAPHRPDEQNTLPSYAVPYVPEGKRGVPRRALLAGGVGLAAVAGVGGAAALLRAGSGRGMAAPNGVVALGFTPDGRTLVVVGGDGLTTVWRCPVQGGPVRTVRLGTSADGSALTLGADARTLVRAEHSAVKLWDTATGRLTATLNGPNESFSVAALSPDGTRLATSGENHDVQFWDLSTGSASASLPGKSDAVGALTFDPDSLHVAIGSADGNTVRIADARGGEVQATHNEANFIDSVAYSPDGLTLAIGGNGTRLWDLSPTSLTASLDDQTTQGVHVAYAPGGKRLASGGEHGGVRIWNAATRALVATLPGARPPLAFAPAGTTLATLVNGTVTLWDVVAARPVRSYEQT
ncbi:serine/threonine-protein kinase [Actinoallomurus sp. NPDC050550]|uniref:WD40 repeat domain-containing serine/threonine protein kinase n=1 Tax=Actinoallomurus sp. NPDC050550 TaxID=3154937 RepID=UPI0033C7F103